jgi:hypothetical protein
MYFYGFIQKQGGNTPFEIAVFVREGAASFSAIGITEI